ncbi:MAG: Uma2 family endonuclease [Chloroflexota bacterium]|nr:Uma2 family endonuclease [Chloroflexota bacterium]
MILHIQASPADVFEMVTQRYPDRRFELIAGETIEKAPNFTHSITAYILGGFLFIYIRAHPIGWVLPEARYKLPHDDENDRIPDLSFIKRIKGRAVPPKAVIPFMPDLAVEVQSPGQSKNFMREKAQYYFANGTQIVWLIYPDPEEIEVMTAVSSHTLTTADSLSGGDLLPSFSLAVKEIFTIQPTLEDE